MSLGALNGFVQENLSGFNVLKLYVREESSQEEFSRHYPSTPASWI